MRVVFTAQAQSDLRDIATFIAHDSKSNALAFVRGLRAAAAGLASAPLAFPLVSWLGAESVRRKVFRDYLIFYRVDAGRIVILRIVHGARDADQWLMRET